MATTLDKITSALYATQGQPVDEQAAAVEQAMPFPSPQAVNKLWKILISGLVAALLFSLAAVSWAVLDGNDGTGPDTLVTLFTAVVTGLIGLFARTPNQN